MKRLFNSFRCAFTGILSALDSEPNLKIHFIAIIITSFAGLFFSIHAWEWCVIILCFVLVVSFEMMNTALEKTLDVVHPEIHSTVKLAKDLAAGAVLISAIGSVVIAGIIFIPKILILF